MSPWIYISYLTTICIFDYLFVICRAAGVTEMNVTGFYGYKYISSVTVVNTSVTWIDAFNGCKSLGYGWIPASNTDGYKFLHLRNHLFLNHQRLVGYPLWLGFVKPNLDGLWYTWGKCTTPLDNGYISTFSNGDNDQRQCLLLNMTENPRAMTHSWYGASCQERHPFVCVASAGIVKMTEYLGMEIHVWDALTKEDNIKDTTLTDCMNRCMVQSACFHAVFNTNTGSCRVYHRELHDLPLEFTLVSVDDNDTVSYVKSEENHVHVVNVPETALTTTYDYTDLPCYVDQVGTTETMEQTQATTSGIGEDAKTKEQGQLDTTTGKDKKQLEESMKSIREENAVDVKTLSSYKNKRISAKDERTSARTFGFIGGVILILVCAMIVLSDIPKMVTDWRKIHRLVKPKRKKINMFIRTHFVPTNYMYNLRRRNSN